MTQVPQVSVLWVPQTTTLQGWALGVEVLQVLHMPKMKQASDFAGRTAAAAVRRNALASSKALVFFMVLNLLGIGASPWGPLQGKVLLTV